METKQCICIEVKKGDHTFSFYMPMGTTWGNSLDAAFEVLQQVHKLSEQSVSQAKPSSGSGE